MRRSGWLWLGFSRDVALAFWNLAYYQGHWSQDSAACLSPSVGAWSAVRPECLFAVLLFLGADGEDSAKLAASSDAHLLLQLV